MTDAPKLSVARRTARCLSATAALVCAALLVSGCEKPEVEGEGAPVDPSVEAALPQGGDYHSTAIRAKGRAEAVMNQADAVRTEQLQDAGLDR